MKVGDLVRVKWPSSINFMVDEVTLGAGSNASGATSKTFSMAYRYCNITDRRL
jgi:hypothetical protein